ncbi:MAG: DUF4270 family protein [Ferruginibacter sp.]
MLKRFLPAFFGATFCFVIINWSCTKLDTTNLGIDVIPAVDNVTTFGDTLDINSTQGVFNDTTKLTAAEDHVLGKISNDPLFGTTDASIFFQLKPGYFPYYFGTAGDTLVGVDSVILTLAYKGVWGDSTVPQVLEVRKIEDPLFDSPYVARLLSYRPDLTGSTVIGSKTIDIRSLPTQVKFAHNTDSSTNQIRIRLSDSFRDLLFSRDSSHTDFSKNAFYSDSLYRNFLKGISVTALSGNALMYINLADAKTRLEVHLRRRKLNNNTNLPDTIFNNLALRNVLSSQFAPSATANYLVRNRTALATTGTTMEHFIQTTPGTFVNMHIPALTGMENRIIHRASIIVEQIPFDMVTDSVFSPPSFMYIDLKDTSTVTPKFKPLYYDLSPAAFYNPDDKNYYFPNSGIDFSYFGGYIRRKINAIGQRVVYYDINVTRYVQHLLTKHTPNYDMRLYAPYNLAYPQYSADLIPYNNALAAGRVRIRSGQDPDRRLRLRLVMIYSKL